MVNDKKIVIDWKWSILHENHSNDEKRRRDMLDISKMFLMVMYDYQHIIQYVSDLSWLTILEVLNCPPNPLHTI